MYLDRIERYSSLNKLSELNIQIVIRKMFLKYKSIKRNDNKSEVKQHIMTHSIETF